MRYRVLRTVAALALIWVASSKAPAWAQGWNSDVPRSASPAQAEPAVDATAVSGPTIYVVDINRHLATINLGTKAVHIVGTMSPQLTDIGFNPTTHVLYGITFTGFYQVNKATAATKFIGNLGQSDANALVFNSSGVAYSAGVNTGDLYRIEVYTGRVAVLGSTGGYGSAGDLVFYNDQLVLAGFKGTRNITTTTPNYLVKVNEKNGAHSGTPVLLPLKEVFGLVSTGKNELYALALNGNDAGLFQIFPTQSEVAKRAVLLADLKSKGLGQILGAAYDGNYQP